MIEKDFLTISYLKNGSTVQQRIYQILCELKLFDLLNEFNPVVTGSLPLDIFIDGSDLDISCEVYDFERFEKHLQINFSLLLSYTLQRKLLGSTESIVCSFTNHELKIEIVGQPIPVSKQLAYKHMIIEYHILTKRSQKFKEKVIQLKRSGIKTEPAFAQLLGLKGDPYQVLLNFAK